LEGELKKAFESTNEAVKKCMKEFEERNKRFIEFFRLLNQLIKEVGEYQGNALSYKSS